MENSFFLLLSILLLLIGMIGTFVPILPGLLLSFGGLLLYKFGVNSQFPISYVWIFGSLTVLSLILNYLIPAHTNRKYGGTRWGSVGSFIGIIVGFFWIPIPFGFLVGMLLGVLIGELLHDSNNKKKALNSVKGAFLGFIYGTGFSFMVALAMFLVVLYYIYS